MSFFHQLTEKPWLQDQDTVVELYARRAFDLHTAKFGLRVFLGVITVVFSLTVMIYSDRMLVPDWRPLPEPWILWLNTVLLILSSVGLQWARVAAGRGRLDGVKLGLVAGGAFAWAFLAGQLWAWQQLVALGYFAATNPANAFFYLVTALHAVHLLGGLVAWARTANKVRRGYEADRVRLSVELCAVYWHFLLVIWLILFGLLLLT